MTTHQLGYPPNIDAIDAAFHVREKRGVVYAYGDTIYNPHAVYLPNFILEHEKVHLARQGDDPAGWWDRYIKDEDFRYAEELAAHAREFEFRRRGKDGKRYTRYALLRETAQRLMAPFYNYKPKTLEQAERDIVNCL